MYLVMIWASGDVNGPNPMCVCVCTDSRHLLWIIYTYIHTSMCLAMKKEKHKYMRMHLVAKQQDIVFLVFVFHARLILSSSTAHASWSEIST